MTRISKVLLVSLLIIAALYACVKLEEKTPENMIVGKWEINSMELMAEVIQGDGSYLIFYSCSDSCSGKDYRASDMTSGKFSYSLSGDASVLTIKDETSCGGNYDGDWDILELTDKHLRIVVTSLFGSLKIEMTKSE